MNNEATPRKFFGEFGEIGEIRARPLKFTPGNKRQCYRGMLQALMRSLYYLSRMNLHLKNNPDGGLERFFKDLGRL
jgi:hypothetical protein